MFSSIILASGFVFNDSRILDSKSICCSDPSYPNRKKKNSQYHKHKHLRSVRMVVDNSIEFEARIPTEARKILYSLASKWSDVTDSRALQLTHLKGAMTNEVYQVNWPTEGGKLPRKVLLRIYGKGVDTFFDRNDEIQTFECMSRHGQGPRLLGRFTDGRVEEFIHARTLSAVDLHDPEISALIAAKMREFHDLDMQGPRKVQIWDRLRQWLKAAKNVCSTEEAAEFHLDIAEEDIANLEKKLSGENQKIGFCHNDLQYGNIMIDEETRSLTIIDYEYASYNFVAYDIANHFCEMVADYHTETPHLLDYNKYPDYDERRSFIFKYLSSSGDEPRDSEVEQVIQDVEKYTLASHLQWGLWGIISGHVNGIDFNFKEYARQRFEQFWLRKSILL